MSLNRYRVVLPLLLTLGSCRDQSHETSFVTPALATMRIAKQQALSTTRRTAIVDAAARLAPAVVSISVTTHRRTQVENPFSLFLPQESEQVVQGFGTGFIIRSDGVIITNQHVVAGAETITVSLADNSENEAKVLGEDPVTDIAVLRINRKGLPVVTTGKSTDLMIGEWVIALGNPYVYLLGNSEPTVTAGVVSATNRNILPSSEQTGLYLDMIQTDASINPGNSGGPLSNALGEVVGVNSSILTSSGGSIGLGFAIPIERALRIADDILQHGSVRRAWTGIDVGGSREMRDWKTAGGVPVQQVAPGSPAARASIRPKTVLVEANGRRLRNFLDWESVKLDLHVGDSVELKIRDAEGGPIQTRHLVSGDVPSAISEKVVVLKGVELVTVTPAVRAERGIRSERGALIFRVNQEVGRLTGLQAGDVVLAVNRTMVSTAAQVGDLFQSMRSQEMFRVFFERDGQVIWTDLQFR